MMTALAAGAFIVLREQTPMPLDHNKNCGAWALQGECTKNEKFMHGICALSCSSRKAPDPDTSETCGAWALQGECKSNPVYMLATCATSCDHVQLAASSPETSIPAALRSKTVAMMNPQKAASTVQTPKQGLSPSATQKQAAPAANKHAVQSFAAGAGWSQEGNNAPQCSSNWKGSEDINTELDTPRGAYDLTHGRQGDGYTLCAAIPGRFRESRSVSECKSVCEKSDTCGGFILYPSGSEERPTAECCFVRPTQPNGAVDCGRGLTGVGWWAHRWRIR
jgi:hypothetical protein